MTFVPLPPELRPYCPEVRADMSCWEIAKHVSRALKRAGLIQAAREFRRQVPEADNDNGMLFTLALHFIRVTEEIDE